MEKLSSVFGILIGIFMFFVPAYTKMENPTGAWIFFPLFGVSTIAFMAFAFLSDEGTSIANAHR